MLFTEVDQGISLIDARIAELTCDCMANWQPSKYHVACRPIVTKINNLDAHRASIKRWLGDGGMRVALWLEINGETLEKDLA